MKNNNFIVSIARNVIKLRLGFKFSFNKRQDETNTQAEFYVEPLNNMLGKNTTKDSDNILEEMKDVQANES